MNKKEILKDKIIRKFKTISNFCSLTNLPYIKTRIILNEDNDEFFNSIEKAYNSINVAENHGLIKEVDRNAIDRCIKDNFKNKAKFSEKHKEFNQVYISNIIGGRLTDETKKYIKLVEILTVQYNLNPIVLVKIKRYK